MKKFPRPLIYLLLLTAVLWLVHLTLIERFRAMNQILLTTLQTKSHAIPPVSPAPTSPPATPQSLPPAPAPAPAVKPIDTASWAVYRNVNYGFGFKYPNDRTIFSAVNEETSTLVPADARSNSMVIAEDESKVFSGSTLLTTGGTPTLLSFEVANFDKSFDWWLDNNLERVIPKENMVSKKDVTFAGKPAVEVVGKETPGGVYKLILIKPGNFFIVILQNKPSKFLDAVLDTFSFNPGDLQ